MASESRDRQRDDSDKPGQHDADTCPTVRGAVPQPRAAAIPAPAQPQRYDQRACFDSRARCTLGSLFELDRELQIKLTQLTLAVRQEQGRRNRRPRLRSRLELMRGPGRFGAHSAPVRDVRIPTIIPVLPKKFLEMFTLGCPATLQDCFEFLDRARVLHDRCAARGAHCGPRRRRGRTVSSVHRTTEVVMLFRTAAD